MLCVNLEKIVHNDRPLYRCAGYGGRPITEWPFRGFIQQHLDGNARKAEEAWVSWLVSQFLRFEYEPKSRGGMRGGSVHRFSAERASIRTAEALNDPALLSEADLRVGALVLVRRRLAMVESIRLQGYQSDLGDQIIGVHAGERVVLQGGHHRAATLHVLGYDSLPNIIVVPGWKWRVKRWRRALKSRTSTVLKNTRSG